MNKVSLAFIATPENERLGTEHNSQLVRFFVVQPIHLKKLKSRTCHGCSQFVRFILGFFGYICNRKKKPVVKEKTN